MQPSGGLHHVELQLLSRVISTGNLVEVLEWGINHEDFQTDLGRGTFTHLYSFFQESAGAVIGPNTLKALLPTFVLCDDPGMTTPALCQMVRTNRVAVQARKSMELALDNLDVSPLDAISNLNRQTQILMEISDGSNKDVTFGAAMNTIYEKYCLAEDGLGESPIKWPWEAIQEESLGLWHDDYVIIYGRPKSMKSWILSYLIAFHFTQGLNILVYTKEMTPENIIKRVAACLAEVPYRELRRGKLTKEDRANFRAVRDLSQQIQHSDRLICLAGKDVSEGGDTIAWLGAKVSKYKPHIVYVDGIYLMSSGHKRAVSDNIRVQAISRQARDLQLRLGIPFVATSQANRKAAGHKMAELDELAFSDAFSQDATAAIRVVNEKVEDRSQNTCMMGIAGSREWDLPGFRIGGVPATDFYFKERVTEKELREAQEVDANDPGESPAEKKKKRKPSSKDAEAAALKSFKEQLESVKRTPSNKKSTKGKK